MSLLASADAFFGDDLDAAAKPFKDIGDGVGLTESTITSGDELRSSVEAGTETGQQAATEFPLPVWLPPVLGLGLGYLLARRWLS